jgi:ribonucleoside-diphosphate reductase alpha chain
MFEDNVNKQNPGGGRVSMSNLCVTGDSNIEIAPNQLGIGSAVISIEDVIEMLRVGGLDHNIFIRSHTGVEDTWQPIEAIKHPRDTTELVEITYEDKVLRCTPDHKIWTSNRGWVQAQDLLEDDELIIS